MPFFVTHAQQVANAIVSAHPGTNVTFALVDYFATLGLHDDGDGYEFHVDIPQFVPASSFGHDVNTTFWPSVLGGGYVYGDSDLSDNILHSSMITATYGTVSGSGLNWSSTAHHVIVLIGSTAPRDPNYVEDYAVSASDYYAGSATNSTTCEPSYAFGNLTEPQCEGWVSSQNGNASDSIAQLTKSAPECRNSSGGACTIDAIDLYATPTDPSSYGWPCLGGTSGPFGLKGGCPNGTAVQKNVQHVLLAGCAIANATGGTWQGPSFFQCPSGQQGSLHAAFIGPSVYSPNLTNPSLFAALSGIGFGEPHRAPHATYPLVFEESGLPSGTPWSVTAGNDSAGGTTSALTLLEPNGSYGYQVGAVAGYVGPPAGSVPVQGGPVQVNVTFATFTYPVTFEAVGLPAAVTWGIAVDGVHQTSMNATITFQLPNGSFTYTVDPVSGFRAPGSGSLVVSGSPGSVSIAFDRVTYPLRFDETGLIPDANGTLPSWGVTLSGSENSTATTDLGFRLSNGTYVYHVLPVPGYRTNWTGTLVVSGAGAAETIPFIVTVYSLTFDEIGLSGGVPWTVALSGGSPACGTVCFAPLNPTESPALTEAVANGTYRYLATAPGFTNLSGSFVVAGFAPAPLTLHFVPSPTPASGTSGPKPGGTLVFIGVALAAVVAAVTLASLALRRRPRRR